ncbi:hypothetical protein EON65_06270 [archaeon]|nr:MAG: hypothetical protein EON65_06270 [archaeon]
MAHLYAVTSHKATAVNFSVICNFTAPNDRNLVVARSNTLYVYTLKDIGLVLSVEIPLFGRIKGVEVYRPLSYEKDTIFVMVEHKHVCLLEFDVQSKQVLTRANMSVQDRIGKDSDLGQKSLIDPEGRLLALRIYNGSLKV